MYSKTQNICQYADKKMPTIYRKKCWNILNLLTFEEKKCTPHNYVESNLKNAHTTYSL